MATLTLLTVDDVAPALAALGRDPSGVVLTGVAAGTVNTSYVARLGDGEELFLRLYEQQEVEGAAREVELLDALAGRGVPTPRPVRRLDGGGLTVVMGKALVAFPRVPGAPVAQREVTARHTRQVGRALGLLHVAAEGLEAPAGRFDGASLASRARAFAGLPDPALVALSAPLADGVLAAAEARRALPKGLVHGDLFRDNVLFAGGELAALLDFESAHRGPSVYDVAVAMLAWCFGASFEWELARALFDGYAKVRSLAEDEWEGLFPELRFACLRFTITRIADETWRVGKRYERFLGRLAELDALGPAEVRARLGGPA